MKFAAAAWVLAALASTAPAQDSPERRLLRALDTWTEAYVAGRYDLSSFEDVGSRSPALALLRRPADRPLPRIRELEMLLDAAASTDSAAAALRIVRLAATGLDRRSNGHRQSPALVRDLAERAAGRLRANGARTLIVQVARGEHVEGVADEPQLRAAALRCLGVLRTAANREVLSRALAGGDANTRLAAAEGLRRWADASVAPALLAALASEREDAVLVALAQALRDAVQSDPAAVPTTVLRDSARAGAAALGRGTWRAELALVELFAALRDVSVVPVLIELLAEQNNASTPHERRSGVLRARVDEVLSDFTGAGFGADRVDQWRAFWSSEGAQLHLAVERHKPSDERRTVAAGFFGIAPEGTHVVFVIDVSLSMIEPYPFGPTSADSKAPLPSKLEVAKTELLRAIDQLAPDAEFNMVAFSGNVHPWHDQLVPADAAHRRSAAEFVRHLQPEPATDLWGGLERGLGFKAQTYGGRYETNVDELFVLSDGAPTAGIIQDPRQILTAITESNRYSCVRIHTVFLDTGMGAGAAAPLGAPGPWASGMGPAEMMAQLAAQNGGRFVQPK